MILTSNQPVTAVKAKLLPAIAFAIAVVAFGLPNAAQNRPTQQVMYLACADANDVIPELIELAPYGTGRVNRTMAWFENLVGIIKDLLSWIFDVRWKSGLSQVGHSVIGVDFGHARLHIDLTTIMNADWEAVEDVMPSKLQSPDDYILGLHFIRVIVDRECRRFLR